MKIVFITPLGFNDRRRYFPEFVLARSLAKTGWSVTACVIAEGEDSCREIADGVSIVRLRSRWEAIRCLPKLILQNDAVHIFHLRNPLGPPSLLLAKLLRRTVIFSEAGLLHDPYLVPADGSELSATVFGPESIKRTLASRYFHLPLTQADKVIFLSRHNMGIANQLGLDKSRTDWLPHVIDGARFKVDEPSRSNLPAQFGETGYALFVGQMKLRKGWNVLLQAIPRVPWAILPKFVFVSPSPQPPAKFTRLVESLAIGNRVAYFGNVSNSALQEFYRNCATVVVPSLYEGFGLATVEAFEAEKPLIASNVAALNEVVQAGVNGYLVPPNDPNALACGIVELMRNEPLRRRMVAGGRKTLEEFAVHKWLCSWKDVYANAGRIPARSLEKTLKLRSRGRMDFPNSQRAVCFTIWFPTHNNLRYADLFPRLDAHVRFHKVTLSRHRVLRGVQYRLWNALSRKLIYPGVLRYFGQRYETLFTVDCHQIPAWPRRESVVVDVDDPVFSPTEVQLLNLPQVKAVIVTTEKAKGIFEQLGVARPICVIPQGVSIEQIDPYKIQDICTRFKGERDVVIGYHAPTLTLCSDGPRRARGDQDDLDFLFAALEKAREMDPRIKLWLFGEPSESVKKYAAKGRAAWIKLFGYLPLSDLLNYISNLDIGVYPRTWSPPPGRFSVKIAQFMACGVPVISTCVDEAFIVREAHCGVVCASQEEFTNALVALALAPEKRIELGKFGRTYAINHLSWSKLVQSYQEALQERSLRQGCLREGPIG